MKVILSTLNSKFIHSCLSIRYLSKYIEDLTNVEIREYTINQNLDFIASDLYKTNADVIGFATYIWNIEETLEICEVLKMVNPKIKIILGGPEVSYDGESILKKYPFVDYIIYGEGEETFRELIKSMLNYVDGKKGIKGLIERENNNIIINPPRPLIEDLDIIPSPYIEISKEYKNKIVYYESSRGCPFNCKFCLSSTIKGLRLFPIQRVKADLEVLIDSKVKQVKFVDRTFNANKEYAMEIMNFIISKDPKDINFHFEVTAHLLDDEMIEFLSTIKEGLFQFEIGVQSTNIDTIKAIGRTTDFEKLRLVTKKIKSYRNIHQHLDLIAGLPYEGYNTFKKSFNDVYEIGPEKIQLGFLKLLKGSELRIDKDKYNYKFLDKPPYEVLENDFIKYTEMIKLKSIEDLVEKYYNDGYFQNTLEFIIRSQYENPFDFYEDFANYWEIKDYNKVSNSRNRLYEILFLFYKSKAYKDVNLIKELIRFDFIKNNRNARVPHFISRIDSSISQSNIHDILKNESILSNYLPDYKDIPTKKTIKNVAIEGFSVDVLKTKEEGYNSIDKDNYVYILFVYQDGVINRCNAYDISHIIKEMD